MTQCLSSWASAAYIGNMLSLIEQLRKDLNKSNFCNLPIMGSSLEILTESF